jgi:hypothetical protein
MAFFQRVLWIFVSPAAVFDDIKEDRVSWWQPWVASSVILMIVGYFSLPIQRAVAAMNPSNMPPETLEKQLEMLDKYGLLQTLIGTPVTILVIGLISAGLGYILVPILSERARFGRFFTIVLYGGIIASCTAVVNVLVIRMKGVDTLRAPEDAVFSVGLSFLAPAQGVVWKSLASSLELFGIWSLVVVAMGLMRVFEMPRNHAIWCVVPLWLLTFALLLVQNLVQPGG